MKNSELTAHSETPALNHASDINLDDDYSAVSSDTVSVKSNDLYKKIETAFAIHSQMNKKSLSDTSQATALKNIIDVGFDDFVEFVIEKNIDLMTSPLARNILSLIHLANLGFDKDNKRFNLEKIKSFLKYLNEKSFTKDKYQDDESEEDIDDIFGSIMQSLNPDMSFDTNENENHISNSAMSFSSDTDSNSDHINRWSGMLEAENIQGILTHNMSVRFLDFIKNEGRKNYYNDIYSRFHKDDIIKTAYILEDSFLYDFLLQSGQISPDELARLPIIGKNKPVVNAHYDALMSPEIMIEFLLQQKLLNPKSQEHCINLFQNKPWFNSGGLQTLIQVIGGEAITPDEMHFFIEWQLKNSDIFDLLFDFFDIQKDYSLVRLNEQNNMRSKHLCADSVKAAYITQTFLTLKSANDPWVPEFFDLDLSRTVELGFYAGLSYKDYFLLRGFDVGSVGKNANFSQTAIMTHKQAGHNLLIV